MPQRKPQVPIGVLGVPGGSVSEFRASVPLDIERSFSLDVIDAQFTHGLECQARRLPMTMPTPAAGGPADASASLKDCNAPPRGGRSEFRDLRNYIFGSSAAIITDISLIVGLGSARTGKAPILAGLLTIAVADNISDSLGIHLYKESEGCGERLSLLSTILNFLSRLLISATFVAIVVLFPMAQATLIGLVWGLLLIVLISYLLSRSNKENPVTEIVKHVLIAVVVIALSRYLGYVISLHIHVK